CRAPRQARRRAQCGAHSDRRTGRQRRPQPGDLTMTLHFRHSLTPARRRLTVAALTFLAALALPFTPVDAQGAARTDTFDVLVYGSEPEGVAAAVTAAEYGLRTALLTPDARIGG